jgi:ribosomal protein S3AE
MNENNAWFKVLSHDFENAEIGEIYGTESNIIGRKITYSASELRDIKTRSGYRLLFKVVSANKTEAKAELDSLILAREQVGRLVRHRSSKMDIVVPIEIEGKKYAVKLLCAINKAENRYKKIVRSETIAFITEEAKDTKLKDLIIEAMTNSIQNKLHKKLNKVYPTRVAEIRAIVPRK